MLLTNHQIDDGNKY